MGLFVLSAGTSRCLSLYYFDVPTANIEIHKGTCRSSHRDIDQAVTIPQQRSKAAFCIVDADSTWIASGTGGVRLGPQEYFPRW
jgi:hypothetical protein